MHGRVASDVLRAGVVQQLHAPVPHRLAAGLYADAPVAQQHEIVPLSAALLDPEPDCVRRCVKCVVVAKARVFGGEAVVKDRLNTSHCRSGEHRRGVEWRIVDGLARRFRLVFDAVADVPAGRIEIHDRVQVVPRAVAIVLKPIVEVVVGHVYRQRGRAYARQQEHQQDSSKYSFPPCCHCSSPFRYLVQIVGISGVQIVPYST